MKKILFLFLGISLLCVGCFEGSDKSLDNYISDLIKNEAKLNNEVIKNYLIPNDYSYDEEPINGVLNVYVNDLDGDKKDDVIISRVKDYDVVLSLYQLSNDELVEKDSLVIGEDFLESGSILDFDLFVTSDNFIVSESIYINSFFADGRTWEFNKITVENGKFVKTYSKNFAGSYFFDEDMEEVLDYVKEAGLDVNNISLFEGKMLSEQIKDITKLFNIKRYVYSHGDDYENKSKYNYGETKFVDYTDNK